MKKFLIIMLSGLFILFSGCQKDLEFLNTEADGFESVVSTRNGVDVELAIEAGIAWLAGEQNADGSWGSDEQVAHTAFALVKLQDFARENGGDPFDNPDVVQGYEFLLPFLTPIIISPQPAGDPDFNGNGLGVYISPSGSHRHTYNAAVTLMALATSGQDPDDLMPDPKPYPNATWGSVVQDMVDYFAYGQNEVSHPSYPAGNSIGAWGYIHNSSPGHNASDNSNSGYVVLALDFAESLMPVTVPQFVKDELNTWIDYIQNDITGDDKDGGSGYRRPDDNITSIQVNILKTGNLIYQMAFVGDVPTTQRVVDAVDYIERHWYNTNSYVGFRPDEYQVMYAMMKGLERMGIKDIDPTNDVPDLGEFDWFSSDPPEGEDEPKGLARMIVKSQNVSGSWSGDIWAYGSEVLSTVWALLTLEKVVPESTITVNVDVKPTSCPNPINRKSKGKIPLAILGTDDFDVYNIDPSTVAIFHEFEDNVVGEAFAVNWSYEDVSTPFVGDGELDDIMDCTTEGADGFTDLVLHFKTQEVVAALGDYLADMNKKDMFILEVKGQLVDDGLSIYGKDVMKIVK